MMFQYRKIIKLVMVLLAVWIIGFLAGKLVPFDPLQINLMEKFSPPSLVYLCGTDELGRDIFSRMLVGFSRTVTVAFLAFISSFFIGALAGSLAGYFYRTWIDRIFNWTATMLFSLPYLLVISAVVSLMNKNLFNSYLVLTGVIWVAPARIVRTGIIKARNEKFVMAEKAMGKSEAAIFFHSLLPVSMGPAFIFSLKYLPELIGLEAGLSFLGLGVQPPEPGLGKMIFDSLNYIYSAWWYALFPASLLFIAILIINIFFRYFQRRSLEF